MLIVAKVLGHGQRGMTHAKAAAGQFIHLTENHHHVFQHARRFHFPVKFFSFAASLADPTENADALVVPDHVVNHFGQQYRFTHARTAEQARFTAALQWHQNVDNLDARCKNLGAGRALLKSRRAAMYRAPLHPG